MTLQHGLLPCKTQFHTAQLHIMEKNACACQRLYEFVSYPFWRRMNLLDFNILSIRKRKRREYLVSSKNQTFCCMKGLDNNLEDCPSRVTLTAGLAHANKVLLTYTGPCVLSFTAIFMSSSFGILFTCIKRHKTQMQYIAQLL